jgi:hypothetical protein
MKPTKEPKKEVFLLLNIFSYLTLSYFSLNLLYFEDYSQIFQNLRPSFRFFENSTKHIETIVKPAVFKFRNILKYSRETVLISVLAFFLVWLFMRFVMRYFLSHLRNSLVFETSKTKREIQLTSSGEYKMKEPQNITNFISSTVFVGSRMKVGFLSFFYGACVYLSQRIQVWCLAISLVQLILFKTGKSFVPLLIFTFFISLIYSFSELKKLKNDIEINGRTVQIKDQTKTTTRGSIIPGDVIILKNGQEAPCDLIFVGVETESKMERIIFSMNECQVTGENHPVRKHLISSKVEKIHIKDLNTYEVLVNDTQHVDEKSIGFGNSILNCDDKIKLIGIACWVSRETKALNQPKNQVDCRQPSPFNGASLNFLI